MCNFISWIEVERDGGTILLYLTDQEVYSKRGRETLAGSQDNDLLGHGAIRAFFNLGQSEGTEHEVRVFWEPELLPVSIALKIRLFDTHWGRMFRSGVFLNDNLCHIVYNAPDEWKAKAAGQLLKQGPTNDELCNIVCYVLGKWRAKAWEQLLKQNPSNDDLNIIVCDAPRNWGSKAAEQLLKQGPTNDKLCNIICEGEVSSKWRAKAWEQLLKQNPSNGHLNMIVGSGVPRKWEDEAGEILKERWARETLREYWRPIV